FRTPDDQPARIIALGTCRRSGSALLAASRRIAARLPAPPAAPGLPAPRPAARGQAATEPEAGPRGSARPPGSAPPPGRPRDLRPLPSVPAGPLRAGLARRADSGASSGAV